MKGSPSKWMACMCHLLDSCCTAWSCPDFKGGWFLVLWLSTNPLTSFISNWTSFLPSFFKGLGLSTDVHWTGVQALSVSSTFWESILLQELAQRSSSTHLRGRISPPPERSPHLVLRGLLFLFPSSMWGPWGCIASFHVTVDLACDKDGTNGGQLINLHNHPWGDILTLISWWGK